MEDINRAMKRSRQTATKVPSDIFFSEVPPNGSCSLSRPSPEDIISTSKGPGFWGPQRRGFDCNALSDSGSGPKACGRKQRTSHFSRYPLPTGRGPTTLDVHVTHWRAPALITCCIREYRACSVACNVKHQLIQILLMRAAHDTHMTRR